MGKNQKKRQISESESNSNVFAVKDAKNVNAKSPNNKKMKTNSTITPKKDVNATKEIVNLQNSSKKIDNKKDIKEHSLAKVESPSKTSVEKKGIKEGKVISSKRKDLFKKKRKDFRENKRKIIRQEEGQFSSVNKLSVEEMKKRISEIESRETLSKTAMRKLRILKKKVEIEEGTVNVQKESPKRKNDSLGESINDQKAKRLKKNNDQTRNIKDIGEKDKITKNQLFIVDRVGDKKNNLNANKKQINKPALKLGSNTSVKKESLDDKEEDDEEEDEEEEQKLEEEGDEEEEEEEEEEESDDSEEINRKADSNDEEDEESKETDEEDQEEVEESEDDALDLNNQLKTNKSTEKLKMTKNETKSSKKENTKNSVKKQKNQNKKLLKDESSIIESKTENSKSVGKDELNKDKPALDLNKQTKPRNNQQDGSAKKQRYVLFIGNLSYESTTVDLKKHFLTKVSKIKDVRIPLKPGTNTPRGFGYVEVENSVDYEKALSLHGTFVNGRPIKVEYTSSGSKKYGNKQEVVHKNKKLHAMRKAGQLAGSKKDSHKRSFRRNAKFNSKQKPLSD